MAGLTHEELEELRKTLHKFDGGLAQAEENSGIGAVLKEIRRDVPYSWNLWSYNRPSDLLVSFLNDGVIGAGRVHAELAELLENETFIINGKNDELPGNLADRFEHSKWGDKSLDFYEALDSAITKAGEVKEVFDDVREYFNTLQTKDPAYQFMYSCMNRDEHILMHKIIETLDPVIELLDKTVGEAEVVKKARLNAVMDKADAKNAELIAYLKEHEKAFDMMDLKLHDASFYEYKDLEHDFPLLAGEQETMTESLFDRFCESTYDQFTDWMNEENIDWDKMRHQVGRTSSFYLHDEGNFIVLSNRDYSIDVQATLGCITDELGYSYLSVQYKKDGKLNRDFTLQDYPNNLSDLLMIASGEMLEDTKKKLEDVIKVYEYIDDTKTNQVEYFKEWLENEEEYVRDSKWEER